MCVHAGITVNITFAHGSLTILHKIVSELCVLTECCVLAAYIMRVITFTDITNNSYLSKNIYQRRIISYI